MRAQATRSNLEPGGHLELADLALPVCSDDNSIPTYSSLRLFCDLVIEAAEQHGRPIDRAPFYGDMLRTAGFVDVQLREFA